MTATERVLRGANDDVLSMDDERVSGGCFFQLTFKDAIAQKIISDYRILTITVSDERVKEIIRQKPLLDLGSEDEEAEEAQRWLLVSPSNACSGVRHQPCNLIPPQYPISRPLP
jgi:predicted helicase